MRFALLSAVMALAAIFAPASASPSTESLIEPEERRGVEQTFLTYPEWFLVHSPAEFASEIAAHPAHEFPFAGHIGQLWSSYASVIREQVRQDYPANPGYHVMIGVIAGSTTLEYALRWIYENTLGRISWALSSGRLSEEDRYAAVVAQDYVDFIRQEPWYLYDFGAKLKKLWSTVPAFGPDMVRKWERRYALTTEYVVKAAYGKLIEKATRAAYTPALMTTRVQVDRMPEGLAIDKVKLLRRLPDGTAILDMPRYYDFRIAATSLAQQGVSLLDIAGNQSVILVTVWADTAFKDAHLRVLFEQPLMTMPGRKRVALIVPVRDLSAFLLGAPQRGLRVEHVYDY
ncbi:hypothetical protein [Undibacterium terreum]|uniref:hypothetical protein n=1 Tax=Undibacterium terreum TaxID=1224302 RepID=UPI001E30A7AE|nr:hypothetical protein [Undibacterium terreum]